MRAASQFALDASGRIDLVPDPPDQTVLVDPVQRELYEEMRYKALALSNLGHNQLGDLSTEIDRFRAALPESIGAVSVIRLWSRGNTLRRRLHAHDNVARSAEHDLAHLPPLVAETLGDLVDTFNIFIVGDPKGRELDQVRLGPQERDAVQAVVDAALSIVEAVQASEGLATPAAVEALTEQVEAARGAPAGIDGDQAVDLSRRTVGNFIFEALRFAYTCVRAEPGLAWKEYRAGVYRGLGNLTAIGVAGWGIISFVVRYAEALKAFVEQAFHDHPALIHSIDVILQTVGRQ